jgi:hypothetical protein
VPLGYRVVDKRLVPDADEAKLVRRIFESYARDGSTSALAWKLNQGSGDTAAKAWSKDRLSRILKNPVYTGLIASGKEVYEGEHEPLVSRELFELVRSKLLARRTVFGRTSDPDYVLRGLLRCGTCGYAIVPATTKKAGRKYRYYRCGIHDNSGSSRCGGSEVPAEMFEAFVLGEVAKIAEQKRFSKLLVKNLENRAEHLRREIIDLPRAIAERSGRTGVLATALSSLSGAARRGPEAELVAIGEEINTLNERLYEAERELSAIDGELLDEAEWLRSEVEDGVARSGVDPRERARLLRGLLEEIVVTGGGERVELRLADWILRSELYTKESE